MKKQLGFGLIEVLVGMAVLGIATVGLIRLLGMQSASQNETNVSLKSIQTQQFLERAIWAQYDGQTGAIAACNIVTNNQISLDAAGTCISGTAGQVWAESKRVSDSGCTFAGLNSRVLSVNGCSTSNSLLRDNINALKTKSEFKVMLWSNTVDSMICVLDNVASPASISGANLNLQLSSDCTISLPSSANTNVRIRLPHWAISFFRKGNGNDGYLRFYYKQG
jgi:prepilin-type N-terminal cleavage/methylation domain-containing protein